MFGPAILMLLGLIPLVCLTVVVSVRPLPR